MNITTQDIDTLDLLQANQNGGRGVSHIKTIIIFLRREEYDKAANVYQIEGDKTRAYPQIKEMLTKMFGCRSHLKHNCNHWLCNSIFTKM